MILQSKLCDSVDYELLNVLCLSLGGVSRAVGYEMILKLDSAGSYDPDSANLDSTGMQFSWYCKRANETFGINYQSRNVTAASCFNNGQYNLSQPGVSEAKIEVSHEYLKF